MSQPDLFQTAKPDMKPDMKPDIQDCLCFAGPDKKPDISGVGTIVPPPCPVCSPGMSGLSGLKCPAPRMTRQQRATAYAAWMAEGQPWPPPAGLVSGLIDAVRARRR